LAEYKRSNKFKAFTVDLLVEISTIYVKFSITLIIKNSFISDAARRILIISADLITLVTLRLPVHHY